LEVKDEGYNSKKWSWFALPPTYEFADRTREIEGGNGVLGLSDDVRG
jgi:hypothetical protein